jgi:heavy metal sensor kinase
MALSIRWRLTLWNVLALALGFLGFGALVYVLLEGALYQGIDRSLLAEFQELEHKPAVNLQYWIREAKEHESIFCVVYEADGTVHERTEELPAEALAAVPNASGNAQPFANLTLPILGRQRVLSNPVRRGDREFRVVLFTGLETIDQELAQLLRVLATAVPIALGLAGGFGYLLARKALAPMRRLRRLAEAITVDHLDQRLPVLNSGDELGQLTQTINAMVGRLERSVAEIRRFTADASHELRTPLTAIRTEAEVALAKPMDTADYQQLLESILEECERLTRIAEQLLVLAREDAGLTRPEAEPVDLANLLASVVETMRPLAEARGLYLTLEGKADRPISGDAARLRPAFYNLLDNAIKYTPQGGRITVRIEQNANHASVIFQDTGIGIPPEHLPRVFDRFYRVNKALSREQGGTGLGLSIAKTVVAAHGGRIELASVPGQGTTCTVTLPAERTG